MFKSQAYLKNTFYVVSLPLLYLFLPVSFVRALGRNHLSALFFFYLANLIILIILIRRSFSRVYQLRYKLELLEEGLNILQEENATNSKQILALKEKINRYSSLKKILEELNQNLDLESVSNTLTSIAFSVISRDRGVSALYLLDEHRQKLVLLKTRKENEDLVIRAKEGDIFDLWVLRHSAPLLIENIKKDFRFDLEKLNNQEDRAITSLISAPLISGRSLLGVLRLDVPQISFYSQADLRFLVTVCDLGAVAIENSLLYQKTQDLAIHDSLTSLYTKGYFSERLREEMARSMRSGLEFCLLMLDIDFFKAYNDKFGHTAGDIVLQNIGLLLSEALEPFNPFVSRFGGEEFCVILPAINKKEGYRTAGTLLKAIEEKKIPLRRQPTSITVSIGVAAFPSDAVEAEELIRKADAAMYEAKQKGRNRVCQA